jgi:F-box interacting protein
MKIPLSPIRSNIGNYHSYLYGFGYDHSRDDYLLVSILASDISPHLEFFSLRENAWKEIEDTCFPYQTPFHYPNKGFLFNGAVHWIVSRRSSLVDVIVGFNLMERKLLEILLPYDFGHYLIIDIGSWVFGEFLSLWTMRNGIIEIWVMKKYKVHSSWTKTLVFPSYVIPNFSPIYSTKNGDVIGTIGGTGLVKYNGKGQMLEHCSYCDDPRGSQVVIYTESLLSLPGDHEQV